MAATSARSFFLLLPLLLCGPFAGVRAEGFSVLPAELAPVPCNDKVVEKLSRLALTYVNEDREDGYKFALNRIANVHLHAQGPAGNVYYLDLDVLETKCHIGSPKPWKRCDVRPFMETQISGNCNTSVLHTPEGYSYLYSYDCTLVPDPPETLQQICPTCPLLLPTDNPQALHAAQVTLAHYRRRSMLSAGLAVKRITRASAQVVPERVSLVEYTVHHCPGGVTGRGSCQGLSPLPDTETAGFCTGSIRGNINVNPEVQVSCEIFKMQTVDVLMPLQPQVLDLPLYPFIPTFAPPIDDPGYDAQPVPSDPPLPPAVDPTTFDPIDPAPFEPSVVDNPFAAASSSSSSSESSEGLDDRRPPPPPAAVAAPLDSSSEEVGGVVALRPPLNFRYQRRERRRRQALVETSPTHSPVFLADFPSGRSPFRSCPGPARYTTV